MSDESPHFVPLVPAEEAQPELTPRAVVLGALLGLVFGVASTYLALKVGLTVSASVPIAVIAIAVLHARNGKRAILEHNITQTAGSAGESVAAAVVFTVPALVFLGYPMDIGTTTVIALVGGILGVLMMVPLRRYLIVKEHRTLRYPEGKACAEILRVGELGGTSASKVFFGMGVGGLLKAAQAIFGGVYATVGAKLSALVTKSKLAYFDKAYVGCDFDPALLGVGYIIGYRTSLIMVAGSLMSALIIIPLIYTFGAGNPELFGFGTKPIAEMGWSEIYSAYARHIGAGAVATGGIVSLIRALPAIRSALWSSAASLFSKGDAAGRARTDRDTPMPVLLAGALGLVALIWLTPMFDVPLLGAGLILAFGFLFSVVSSRVTGEVGSTSNPLSGMTIAVLMGTCGIFLMLGWTDPIHKKLALTIGAVVCIAVSQAGTCSQDLKTGYLVGATPILQQGALVIGVLTSVLAVGSTAYLLNLSKTKDEPIAAAFQVTPEALEGRGTVHPRVRAEDGTVDASGAALTLTRLGLADLPEGAGLEPGSYLVDAATREVKFRRFDGIGGDELAAPQASLMATVISGILDQKLPWDLILIGAAIALFMELLGISSLTFAVGLYLKLQYTAPVFLGGLVRKLADRAYKRVPDAEEEPEGTLFSSGLIAGAAIVGVLAAMQGFLPGYDEDSGLVPGLAFLARLPFGATGGDDLVGNWFGAGVLALLGFLMFRAARPSNSAP
ncbi:MAG: oligopeptide transporter, OPT family [Planctomycetota bacterium]